MLFLLELRSSYARRAWHLYNDLLGLAFLVSSDVLDGSTPSKLTMLTQSYLLLRLGCSDIDFVLSRSFVDGFKKGTPALSILDFALRLLAFPDVYTFRICPLRGGS